MDKNNNIGGLCQCGSVQYIVPEEPVEIANCHCTICQRVHHRPYVGFAKYPKNEVEFFGLEHVKTLRTSPKAVRGYCSKCNTYLYMMYDNSPTVWLVTENFNFPTDNIEHYNIYTDTAIVPLP